MSSSERNVEVRFSTDAAGLAAAWASPHFGASGKSAASQTLKTTYYDTAEGDLRRHGMTLRLRRVGRSAPRLAFKWGASPAQGPFASGEIDVRHPAGDLDPSVLGEFVASELRRTTEGRPLAPQFDVAVNRRQRRVTVGGLRAMATFEDGEIVAGARCVTLRQIELELLAGDPAALFDFAAEAALALPLRLEPLSAPARGLLLAADERPAPVKAGETTIPAQASFSEAATLIIGEALQHFLANWPALREGDHPEAIHQIRVALRRLRALLALFHRSAPCAEYAEFRAEAKRIASALGPARETDAFAELLAAAPQSGFGRPDAFAALGVEIAARRETLQREARALIDTPACSLFVLRLRAFAARRASAPEAAGESARDLAASALDRLLHRALKQGRKLSQAPDEARHELRIALKNLRYAAEVFGGLFTEPPEVRAYLRRVAKLQDLLGAHNDAAGARTFLEEIDAPARASTAFAAGATLGWLTGGAVVAEHDLARAWKAFKRTAPFWS